MEQLWAPWRFPYIKSDRPPGCVLCDAAKERKDDQNLIVLRGENNFVILNAYPYNPAHVMVAPYSHVGSPGELSREELANHIELVVKAIEALRKAFSPAGFNTGMNLGRVAGAGIEDHIHTHVVPRWEGDTNFMPILADTKVLSESMESVYKKLKEYLV
ncbi:MAG: HIT domain-containing protein [Dehalococcoidia bacterium]|nr:HIT domain-containing protein [Dehalococcoidia bacterium]